MIFDCVILNIILPFILCCKYYVLHRLHCDVGLLHKSVNLIYAKCYLFWLTISQIHPGYKTGTEQLVLLDRAIKTKILKMEILSYTMTDSERCLKFFVMGCAYTGQQFGGLVSKCK